MLGRRHEKGRAGFTLLEALLVLVLTGAFLWGIARVALEVYFKTTNVRPGVRFLGIEVGGLSRETLARRLEAIVDGAFRDPVLLRRGDAFHIVHYRDHFLVKIDTEALIRQAEALEQGGDLWSRARRYLEADFEPVELPWEPTLDREHTRKGLARLLGDEVEARRTFAFYQEDGRLRVVVTAGEDQLESLLDKLEEVCVQAPLLERKELAMPEILDRGHEKVVDPAAAFTHSLAKATSRFAIPEQARLVNIARLLERTHGWIVNPGEELSLSRAAGPFTTESGYVEAVSEAYGEPVTMPGVGVDQAAAALFDAMVHAGARVTRQDVHPHFTREVDAYTSPGWDVALLQGGDLILENPWRFPLQVTGELSPERVRFEIRGLEPLPDTVEIRAAVPEKIPYKTELLQDPLLPRGAEQVDREGVDGFRVKVFRKIIRADGRETPEHLLGGQPIDYAPRPSRIRIGTGDPETLRRLLAPAPHPGFETRWGTPPPLSPEIPDEPEAGFDLGASWDRGP